MKKKLMLSVFVLFVCSVYSQSVEEMVNGPISGYTFLPKAQTVDFNIAFSSRSATSFWDYKGNETSYSYIYEGEMDPKLIWSNIFLSCRYSFNNDLSFFVSLPIIINQKLEANPAPGYEDYYPDLTGQTGIGDIEIGGEYLISKSSQVRTALGMAFQVASGTSPDDIGDNEFSSTGSGHTAVDYNMNTDIKLNPSVLFSGGLNYRINNKASFSNEGYSWDEKEGNLFSIYGRITFNVSSNFGLGAKAYYSTAGEDKFEGEEITDSSADMFSILPMIGYQFSSNDFKINYYTSYRIEIAGKNYAKANGIRIGLSIFK